MELWIIVEMAMEAVITSDALIVQCTDTDAMHILGK
jgi:hypothetical protein